MRSGWSPKSKPVVQGIPDGSAETIGLGKFAQWLERRHGQALESWFNVQLVGVEIRLNNRMDRLVEVEKEAKH